MRESEGGFLAPLDYGPGLHHSIKESEMARRGRKRAATESPLKPKSAPQDAGSSAASESERQLRSFNDRELERRVVAIQAIRDAEIENLLSRLHLLRSYFSKEQLETPALKFFQKNLGNVSMIRNEQYKVYELDWCSKLGCFHGNHVDGANLCAPPDNSATMQSVDTRQFSVKSLKSNFLESVSQLNPDFVLNEPSENHFMGSRDAFRTPGDACNGLSFGMVPKTLRLPKKGEMLLSVQGSPLGVYREENLEAIHESEDGSHGEGS